MKKVVSSKTAGFNLYANSYRCEDVVSVELTQKIEYTSKGIETLVAEEGE